MDVNTSNQATQWQPSTEEWGLAAYEETKTQFVDLVMNSERPRAQAYALWALSHDAGLSGRELFNFRTGCGNDQPDPEQVQKARDAIKGSQSAPGPQSAPAPQSPPPSQSLAAPQTVQAKVQTKVQTKAAQCPPAPKAAPKSKARTGTRKGKGLSKMEKAILANFNDASKTIKAYKAAKQALAKAQRDLDKAGEKIRLIDPDKAKLLSQLDSQAASVLKDLGILD